MRLSLCSPLCALLFLSACSDLRYNYQNNQWPPQVHPVTEVALFTTAVARGTALSAVRQPVTTAVVGASVLWERPRELLTGNIPDPTRILPAGTAPPGSEGFENALDQAGIPASSLAKLTWFVDGKRFFPEYARQIAAARESIDTQVYIFDNDDIAVHYADLLKQRSSTAKVRVLFDDLGSSMARKSAPETKPAKGFVPPDNMTQYFRDGSNVHVRRILDPWMVCDHSKLHVFDQRIAFMGCMNIGREYYSEWHDMMFRVEGPAVAILQEDFNRNWRHAGPAGIFGSLQRKPAVAQPPATAGMIPVRIMRTDSRAHRYEIYNAMKLAIRSAHKRVWIESPYISNDNITEALEDAARRGVDVRMIYPGKNDSKIMDIGNQAVAAKILKAGGKAWIYPRMSHLKVMVCDDWATVGSANLDTLSMRLNREINIAFHDMRQVNEVVNRVFVPDMAVSKRHTASKPVSPAAGLAEAAADQL